MTRRWLIFTAFMSVFAGILVVLVAAATHLWNPPALGVIAATVALGGSIIGRRVSWRHLGGLAGARETERWVATGSLPADVPPEVALPRLALLVKGIRSVPVTAIGAVVWTLFGIVYSIGSTDPSQIASGILLPLFWIVSLLEAIASARTRAPVLHRLADEARSRLATSTADR